MHRLRRGQPPIEPAQHLGHASNYLFMLDGEEAAPDAARALEQYWIATIDHGFNASTFTARVIASTRADLGAAMVGAMGALSGPLHGGAPGRVWEMLDEIGTPEKADAWLRTKLDRGERIMGFGHAVYRTEDPRSRLLRAVAERLGGPRVELARYVEKRALELLRELRPGHELYTNVEFYASIVLEAVGLPPDLFTPTFALSRIVGWSAHILEQLADPRIIRPTARYVGPSPGVAVPDLD
jgi:citrate synthase